MEFSWERNGQSIFAVGLNYWARETGPLMWRNWREESVRVEINHMRAMGCRLCRAFLFTPDFAPKPFTLDPVMMERLDTFLDICRDADLGVLLTLLVGHMSAENWHPSWLEGRDIYADPEAVACQAWYCHEVAWRYRGHPAIAGWVLTNETTNYAKVPDAASGLIWAKTLVKAVREGDPSHPVGIGDGALEAYGHDNGLRIDDLVDELDFFGPHTYHQDSDELRHAQTVPFLIELCHRGRPVLLEEFGASTSHCSPENQAIYYRETLHSALLAGATGALGWCYSDFALDHQRPYAHHPHELNFGITDFRGEPKAASLELSEFANLVKQLDLKQWRRPIPEAAIVVPSHQASWRYPFNDPDLKALNGVLLEAYTLARQANIPITLFREPPVGDSLEASSWDFPPNLRLLILPHCQTLTGPGYEALFRFAQRGGTVYLSFHIDPATPDFERMFGGRHQLRYGLVETPPATLTITPVVDWGTLTSGAWSYKPTGMPRRSSFCPLQATSARVLAADQDGRPAILENRIGQGRVIFCAYPIEYYLWNTANIHQTDETHRLYRALRDMAGLRPIFDGDNPWVELSWLQGQEGYLLWVINRSWHPQETVIDINVFQDSIQARDLTTGAPVDKRLALDAKEIRVLRIIAE